MAERKVYISSTFKDLDNIRSQIISIIQDADILGNYYDIEYIMESMKTFGNSETALQQCLKAVSNADVYILIIGNWYGSTVNYLNKDISYTQHEYLQAIKSTKNPRIYILHSDSDYDKLHEQDVSTLCSEKFTLEENNKRIKEFKNVSLQGRTKPVTFSSIDILKDKIKDCLIGDIAYYFLSQKADFLSDPKLKYFINRKKQDELLVSGIKKNENRKIYPALIFYKGGDDKPDYFAYRVMYEKCAIANRDLSIIRSSNYTHKLPNPKFDTLIDYINFLKYDQGEMKIQQSVIYIIV